MQTRFVIATAAAVALALAGTATVTAAAIADQGQGQVKFTARQSDVDLEGRFGRFSADIDFDPANPRAGRIKVAIETGSADAGSSDSDSLLRSREFFDAARFPVATFEATSITGTGDGRFEASGPFTLKGHSGNLVVPFTARRDGANLWFEGRTTISRLAYKVGEGQWADTGSLDDAVLIEFKLQMAR
jgi:polyisoprenoid-binding protein YceI